MEGGLLAGGGGRPENWGHRGTIGYLGHACKGPKNRGGGQVSVPLGTGAPGGGLALRNVLPARVVFWAGHRGKQGKGGGGLSIAFEGRENRMNGHTTAGFNFPVCEGGGGRGDSTTEK